ncbi:hypothetical protein PFISCL1PPCAC_24358, partial [Pristionchus fissidentatus]
MDEDDGVEYDLVGSHFNREFDLSIERESTLGNDFMREFEEKQAEIEKEVNETKMKISDLCVKTRDKKKWRMHTQKTHLMGGLRRKLDKQYSNAFCKFYQILVKFPRLIHTRTKKKGGRTEKETEFDTLHLCEIPGHFLSAIDHYITLFHTNLIWEWMANSLNPHYEFTKASDMFLDDKLVVNHSHRWTFGEDNSGDVTRLAGSLRKSKLRFDLVTADGSTYSLDHPEDQESMVVDILRGEVECALASLREGGSFVMKVYSTFTLPSTRLFSLLRSLFTKVVIYKPPSSKSGNTERYIICTEFHRKKSKKILKEGGLEEYLKSGEIDRKDCERILASSRFFSNLQIKSMENNIDLYLTAYKTPEQVNNLVDLAIERVMTECAMYPLIIRRSEFTADLHGDHEKRPWKDQFGDNLVERLKMLEDSENAETFLSQEQVKWVMEDDGEELEDMNIDVEWAPREMLMFTNPDSLILVPPSSVPNSKILHSLFVNPEIWMAVESMDPKIITDMCRNETPMKDDDFNKLMCSLPLDERGFIRLRVDAIPSHIDWIRFLLFLLSQLRQSPESFNGLTLLQPSSSPLSNFSSVSVSPLPSTSSSSLPSSSSSSSS